MNAPHPSVWIERLTLTDFRNYAHLTLEAGPGPVVLYGANGAGKTNLLEAVSMLSPGQGLRRATFIEMARHGGGGEWIVAARINRHGLAMDVGTGLKAGVTHSRPNARLVRIGGETQSGSGALADIVEIAWLTPALDGLLTGPAAERRRYLDRLILCFDPGHRTRSGHFERAMRQRNRLLEDGRRPRKRRVGPALVAALPDGVEGGNRVAARRRDRNAGLGHNVLEPLEKRLVATAVLQEAVALAHGALEMTGTGAVAGIETEDQAIEIAPALGGGSGQEAVQGRRQPSDLDDVGECP